MQVSLLSPAFLALSVTAILLLSLLRSAARQAAFLAINLVFVAGLVLGWVGAISSVSFVLFGYLLARLSRRYAGVGLGVGIVSFTAIFVYMRRSDFLDWILPEALLTRALVTAGSAFCSSRFCT
jgi:hypothetical protein